LEVEDIMLRPVVDPGLCIGSANCVHLAPRAFALGSHRTAIVANPIDATDDELRQAERLCPTAAITLINAVECSDQRS
jgi:ferredoxin